VPSPALPTNAKALDEIAGSTDKEAVRRFVAASFDYVASVLAKLTEIGSPGNRATGSTVSSYVAAESGVVRSSACLDWGPPLLLTLEARNNERKDGKQTGEASASRKTL
jgi:hypothetical protein